MSDERPQNTQRDELGRIKKGSTANPGGRPKLDAEAKALIVEMSGPLTVKAIKTLERNMDNPDGSVSNTAARIWLGKTLPDAAVAIELTGKDGSKLEFDYAKLSTTELRDLKALLERARVAQDDSSAATH
jgi:hypothetical protein